MGPGLPVFSLAGVLREAIAAFRAFPGPGLVYFALLCAWNWGQLPVAMPIGTSGGHAVLPPFGEMVAALLVTGVLAWCHCGVTRAAILAARKEAVTWNDAATPAIDYLQGAFVVMVSGVAMLLGMLLFMIPGILLMVRWSQCLYVVLDHKARWLAALPRSRALTKGQRSKILALGSLMFVLAMPGTVLFLSALWTSIPWNVVTVSALAPRNDATEQVVMTFGAVARRNMAIATLLNVALYTYFTYVGAALYVALDRLSAAAPVTEPPGATA